MGFPRCGGDPPRGELFYRTLHPGNTPLEDAIQKADVLIEALQWIRQFRGKITVIKLGGSVMEDDRAMIHLLLDVVFMETVGMRQPASSVSSQTQYARSASLSTIISRVGCHRALMIPACALYRAFSASASLRFFCMVYYLANPLSIVNREGRLQLPPGLIRSG